ncbi:hypothetical protein [Nostoc sp.]
MIPIAFPARRNLFRVADSTSQADIKPGDVYIPKTLARRLDVDGWFCNIS